MTRGPHICPFPDKVFSGCFKLLRVFSGHSLEPHSEFVSYPVTQRVSTILQLLSCKMDVIFLCGCLFDLRYKRFDKWTKFLEVWPLTLAKCLQLLRNHRERLEVLVHCVTSFHTSVGIQNQHQIISKPKDS